MGHSDAVARWRAEKTAAWLYGTVADCEPDPVRKRLYADLALATERQADIIAKELPAEAPFRPELRAWVAAFLVRRFGPRRSRALLAAMKIRGLSTYSQPVAAPVKAQAGHPMPLTIEDVGNRHRSPGGGTLRAAVFGANDGLVSNTCLVMGVAGAAADPQFILLSGIAGLLAGAFSMSAGEFVSVLSQREMFEYQIAQEREELELYPAEEAEELALIYAARGVAIEDARRIASIMVADPVRALDTLAREELGLNPDDLGSPIGAALSSFGAFAVGAVLPLIPFIIGVDGIIGMNGGAVPVAAGLAGIALFGVGALLSLFSGRSALVGGARMLAIGAGAAAATYFIGSLFDVAVS